MNFRICRTLLPISSSLSAFSSSSRRLQRYSSTLTPSAPTPTTASNDVANPQNINTETNPGSIPKSERTERKLYTTKLGEEMVFTPCKPPPGFIFVPAGNPFITRHCRKLASKVYVVFKSGTRRKPPQQQGIYISGYVHMKVTDLFEDKRLELEEAWRRDIESSYPSMPSGEKSEVHRLICSENPTSIKKTVSSVWRVQRYAEERYTNLKSLKDCDYEAREAAQTKAAQIVASWGKEKV